MAESNHVCKNKHCNKKYYACDWCARTEAFRKVTCSRECYTEYAKEWIENHPNVDLDKVDFALPIEIGRTRAQTIIHMQEISEIPIEQVESETKQELSDMGYGKEVEELGISGTIELINDQLDQESEKPEESVINEPVSEVIDTVVEERPKQETKWTKRNRKNKSDFE